MISYVGARVRVVSKSAAGASSCWRALIGRWFRAQTRVRTSYVTSFPVCRREAPKSFGPLRMLNEDGQASFTWAERFAQHDLAVVLRDIVHEG